MTSKICQDGIEPKTVDGQSCATSNWMRFVDCARNEEEYNLQAYQYCGNIYYRTLKTIAPHTEFLDGNGHRYANQIGLSISDGNHRHLYKCIHNKCILETLGIVRSFYKTKLGFMKTSLALCICNNV